MAIRDRVIGAALLAAALAACQGTPPSGTTVIAHSAGALPARHHDDVGELFFGGAPVRPPAGNLVHEAAGRRAALAERLGPGVVWLEAGSETNLGRFFQEDNFYYLSGVVQADIAMAIHVGEGGRIEDEVLFLQPYNETYEVWNGARLNPGEEAERATGFASTRPLEQKAEALAAWAPAMVFALETPETELPEGSELDTRRLGSELATLRLVKSDYEIDCLTNAINITTNALHHAIAAVRPGVHEYVPQGALEGTFISSGSERPGFNSIFGSGPNSVALHYNHNNRLMQDGDIIVMDVGAKYRYYCADVTRTVPVNGRFTERQREVYTAVLDAQTAAAEAARPGMTIGDLDTIARDVITERGFGPGRKYFKHSVGHWIGLDVHDVGGRAPMEVGTLFTIEPGIYIDEEELGVRIEDDYIMTADGAVKLSSGVPSDPDAIETMMAGRR